MTIRVMVVDDQAVVRAGLRTFLRDAPDMHLVGETGDGAHAVEIATRSRPDVVLTEIRLPGLDGAELTRRIRTTASPTPHVIILTTLDLDQHVFACLRAGASGFLLKDTPPAELLSAIRVVAIGEPVFAPTVTRRLVDCLLGTLPVDPASSTVLDTLTPREQEVLELIARGLSNADIAGRLYMSIGTVKSHVSRILTKLGLRDRVQAVILAYQTGLVRATSRELTTRFGNRR
ncbi:MAG TPA: response regulator transcription factor [Planosporangium sp.]|nr:response regulator transcription factor [Planosporangium sp.]